MTPRPNSRKDAEPRGIRDILEDAYKLGKTDATLDANDHDIILPKMIEKLQNLIEEEVIGEDEYTTRDMDIRLSFPRAAHNELRAEQRAALKDLLR